MKSNSTSSRRNYGGISADDRDELRRAALVEAGIAGFGVDGFNGTTIESLCSAAKLSTRDFYSCFDSKENLLLEVYDKIVAESMTAVAAAFGERELLTAEDALAAIEATLGAFAHSMTADARRARINFVVVVGVSERVELRRRTAIHQFAALIETFIGMLRERELINEDVISPVLGVALVGAVHETLTDWVTGDERRPLEQVVDGLVAVFRTALPRPATTSGAPSRSR